jgi:hypothetical protein
MYCPSPSSSALRDEVRREGRRNKESDRANQQAIAYPAYAIIIRPENI